MIDIDIDIAMYHDIFITQHQHRTKRRWRSQGPNNVLKYISPLGSFV